MAENTILRPEKTILSLKPGDEADPIEIKVLRKWVSYGSRSECCFIFIDKYGYAIQASASLSDQTYFQNLIRVSSCYRSSNYICEPGKTYMISVPHHTRIRIGKAAIFQEIVDDDYIGRLEYVSDPFKPWEATIMKMKLEKLSGKIVHITFWNEIALSFDKESLASLSPPVIIAITSMKVTEFNH